MPKCGRCSCVSAGRIADAEGSAPHGSQPIYSDFRVTLPIKACTAVLIEFHRHYLDVTYVINTTSGELGVAARDHLI